MFELFGLSGVVLGAVLIGAALVVAFVAAVSHWILLTAALVLLGIGVYAIFAVAA